MPWPFVLVHLPSLLELRTTTVIEIEEGIWDADNEDISTQPINYEAVKTLREVFPPG